MKKRFITIATPEILSLCKDFTDNQKQYAAANGYEFDLVQTTFWKHLHPSFSKVHEIDRAFKEGFEVVLWADADVAFMDQNKDLAELLTGDYFMAAYQQQNWWRWVYLCAGLMVWKNTQEARAVLVEWIDRVENGSPAIVNGERIKIEDTSQREPVMQDKPWEQWYLDELVRETKWHNIRACKGDEIGCFCPEIWHDGVKWKPGMPTIHMAGSALWEKRAEIFRDIYEKQVIKK
jgi:hypothetical protein